MTKFNSFNEERNSLLREDNQKESNKYLEALKEVERFGREVVAKKQKAEIEIPSIKKKIALLNVEYYKEKDGEKLKEIEDKKLQLRLKLNDLESLIKTNVRNIIIQKYLKDIQGYEDKAREEHMFFLGEVRARRGEYLDLKREIQQKLNELSLIEKLHPYNRTQDKKEEVKNIEYLQDDGWVGGVRREESPDTTHIIFASGETYGGKTE